LAFGTTSGPHTRGSGSRLAGAGPDTFGYQAALRSGPHAMARPRGQIRAYGKTDEATIRISTVDLAALTGRRHLHVLRDARKMLVMLAESNQSRFGSVDFDGTYTDMKGEERPCLLLPPREAVILSSGYSVHLRRKIVDRLIELKFEPVEIVAPSSRKRLASVRART
jgi:regulatory protein Rha